MYERLRNQSHEEIGNSGTGSGVTSKVFAHELHSGCARPGPLNDSSRARMLVSLCICPVLFVPGKPRTPLPRSELSMERRQQFERTSGSKGSEIAI